MGKIWKIHSLDELYTCLNSNESKINAALSEKDKYYRNEIEIPKKNGSIRKICAVDKSCQLYSLQRKLKKYYLDNIMLSDKAFGFVKGSSYLDFLSQHTNKSISKYYFKIDLKNFFDSITSEKVMNALAFSVEDGEEKEEIIKILVDLLTYNGKIVQGSPTSPTISNIVFRPIDIRIERYCNKQKIVYSRYADDLLFSSLHKQVQGIHFLRTIERILGDYSLQINRNKTKRTVDKLYTNGYVIDGGVHISRNKMKFLSATLFYLDNHKYKKNPEWHKEFNQEMKKYGITIGKKDDLINYLSGNRSYLISVVGYSQEEKFKKSISKKIKRIEKHIRIIEDA